MGLIRWLRRWAGRWFVRHSAQPPETHQIGETVICLIDYEGREIKVAATYLGKGMVRLYDEVIVRANWIYQSIPESFNE